MASRPRARAPRSARDREHTRWPQARAPAGEQAQQAGDLRRTSPRVGGHHTGRIWRQLSAPWPPDGDPGRLEAGAGGHAPHPRRLLRRRVQPNRPSASTSAPLSSPKILVMLAEGPQSSRRVNVLGCRYLTGRFSGVDDWPVLGVDRGLTRSRRLLPQVSSDAIDRLLPLVEHRSKQVPHVDHVLPWLVADRHARLSGVLSQPGGVVE